MDQFAHQPAYILRNVASRRAKCILPIESAATAWSRTDVLRVHIHDRPPLPEVIEPRIGPHNGFSRAVG